MRQLLEKIEENANFIERERSKITFALSDDKIVTAWESNIKAKGTPLQAFYDNWSKINKIQKRKKITRNDEIAGAGELPMIKRPKMSQDEAPKLKPDNKGPMVLFPSDSEDEGNDDPFTQEEDKDNSPPKKVKKVKKKDLKKKKVSKNIVVDDTDDIVDKDDIVLDFSAGDW